MKHTLILNYEALHRAWLGTLEPSTAVVGIDADVVLGIIAGIVIIGIVPIVKVYAHHETA
jgi:hypothetical protein